MELTNTACVNNSLSINVFVIVSRRMEQSAGRHARWDRHSEVQKAAENSLF